MNKNTHNFDSNFDLLYLPSKGLFYPNKKSSLMIKYLTGYEEMILTSPSLSESGMALKMILEVVIMDNDVEVDDLLVADKDAIIMFLRSTSYGDNFPLEFECSNCHQKVEQPFKISSLEMKDVTEEPDENGEFEYILPIFQKKVKFKPLTVADEIEMEKMMAVNQKHVYGIDFKEEATARYMFQITEFNGNGDKKYIEKSVRRMPLKDSISLKEYIDKVEPGIDKKVNLKCTSCQKEYFDNLRIGSEFLGLTPAWRKNINEEIFLISYYSQGGINRESAMKMSVADRKWYINRISLEIEKKNKAEEDAMKKAKNKSSSTSSRFK